MNLKFSFKLYIKILLLSRKLMHYLLTTRCIFYIIFKITFTKRKGKVMSKSEIKFICVVMAIAVFISTFTACSIGGNGGGGTTEPQERSVFDARRKPDRQNDRGRPYARVE